MEHTTRNEVLLLGRLSVAPEPRELPSGDEITTFRLVVDRPPGHHPARLRRGGAARGLPGFRQAGKGLLQA